MYGHRVKQRYVADILHDLSVPLLLFKLVGFMISFDILLLKISDCRMTISPVPYLDNEDIPFPALALSYELHLVETNLPSISICEHCPLAGHSFPSVFLMMLIQERIRTDS